MQIIRSIKWNFWFWTRCSSISSDSKTRNRTKKKEKWF